MESKEQQIFDGIINEIDKILKELESSQAPPDLCMFLQKYLMDWQDVAVAIEINMVPGCCEFHRILDLHDILRQKAKELNGHHGVIVLQRLIESIHFFNSYKYAVAALEINPHEKKEISIEYNELESELSQEDLSPPNSPKLSQVSRSFLDFPRENCDLREFINKAKSGDAIAQFRFACYVEQGLIAEQDLSVAISYYYLAATNSGYHGELSPNGVPLHVERVGFPPAQYRLGRCLFLEIGVKRDFNQAFYWFLRAALNNNADGQFCVGKCFQLGYGTEVDFLQAQYWLRKAAENGHHHAREHLEGFQQDNTEHSQEQPCAPIMGTQTLDGFEHANPDGQYYAVPFAGQPVLPLAPPPGTQTLEDIANSHAYLHAASRPSAPSLTQTIERLRASEPKKNYPTHSIYFREEELDFSKTRKLGKGASGKVKTAILIPLKMEVAVKLVDQSSVKNISRFENEVQTMVKLNHRNIIQYYGRMDKKGKLGIIMECCPLGNLHKLLDDKNIIINMEERYYFGCQISSSLEYLHGINIIHRDLKPDNILVVDLGSNLRLRWGLKICDFGISRQLDDSGTRQTLDQVGTPIYMSPEVLCSRNNLVPISSKSDIYSFGMVFYEIVTRRKSFSLSLVELIPKIVTEHVRPSFPVELNISPNIQSLIERAWDHFPEIRPTATYIRYQIVKVLEPTENVDKKSEQNLSRWMSACKQGEIGIVVRLLSRGFSVNCVDDLGMTGLMCASSIPHLELVRELISRGAHVNMADNRGWTALIYATIGASSDLSSKRMLIDKNQLDVIRCLLEHGALITEEQRARLSKDAIRVIDQIQEEMRPRKTSPLLPRTKANPSALFSHSGAANLREIISENNGKRKSSSRSDNWNVIGDNIFQNARECIRRTEAEANNPRIISIKSKRKSNNDYEPIENDLLALILLTINGIKVEVSNLQYLYCLVNHPNTIESILKKSSGESCYTTIQYFLSVWTLGREPVKEIIDKLLKAQCQINPNTPIHIHGLLIRIRTEFSQYNYLIDTIERLMPYGGSAWIYIFQRSVISPQCDIFNSALEQEFGMDPDAMDQHSIVYYSRLQEQYPDTKWYFKLTGLFSEGKKEFIGKIRERVMLSASVAGMDEIEQSKDYRSFILSLLNYCINSNWDVYFAYILGELLGLSVHSVNRILWKHSTSESRADEFRMIINALTVNTPTVIQALDEFNRYFQKYGVVAAMFQIKGTRHPQVRWVMRMASEASNYDYLIVILLNYSLIFPRKSLLNDCICNAVNVLSNFDRDAHKNMEIVEWQVRVFSTLQNGAQLKFILDDPMIRKFRYYLKLCAIPQKVELYAADRLSNGLIRCLLSTANPAQGYGLFLEQYQCQEAQFEKISDITKIFDEVRANVLDAKDRLSQKSHFVFSGFNGKAASELLKLLTGNGTFNPEVSIIGAAFYHVNILHDRKIPLWVLAENERFNDTAVIYLPKAQLMIFHFDLNSAHDAKNSYDICCNHIKICRQDNLISRCVIGINRDNMIDTAASQWFEKFKSEYHIQNSIICELSESGKYQLRQFISSLISNIELFNNFFGKPDEKRESQFACKK